MYNNIIRCYCIASFPLRIIDSIYVCNCGRSENIICFPIENFYHLASLMFLQTALLFLAFYSF